MMYQGPEQNQNQREFSQEPSPTIVAEVYVQTATALICHPDDPYLILIGDSEKHPHPVLPGGKLENYERHDIQSPGYGCVTREVAEEIGTEIVNPEYIGMANDPNRGDTRIVPPSKLKGAYTDPPLDEDVFAVTNEDIRIRAHYGVPDHIYRGTVDPEAITETEELTGNRFIDIRTLGPGELSAGHDLVVFRYREMLDSGASSFPVDALSDFNAEKERIQ